MGWTDDVEALETGAENPRLEPLTAEECLALLRTQTVGRLGISAQAGPLVVPVNFVMDGDSIVFRSGAGAKLRALARRPVSFQVDVIDLDAGTGWSVLARGRAREVGRRSVEHLDLTPFVPDGRDHWVRMRIAAISGRRIVT